MSFLAPIPAFVPLHGDLLRGVPRGLSLNEATRQSLAQFATTGIIANTTTAGQPSMFIPSSIVGLEAAIKIVTDGPGLTLQRTHNDARKNKKAHPKSLVLGSASILDGTEFLREELEVKRQYIASVSRFLGIQVVELREAESLSKYGAFHINNIKELTAKLLQRGSLKFLLFDANGTEPTSVAIRDPQQLQAVIAAQGFCVKDPLRAIAPEYLEEAAKIRNEILLNLNIRDFGSGFDTHYVYWSFVEGAAESEMKRLHLNEDPKKNTISNTVGLWQEAVDYSKSIVRGEIQLGEIPYKDSEQGILNGYCLGVDGQPIGWKHGTTEPITMWAKKKKDVPFAQMSVAPESIGGWESRMPKALFPTDLTVGNNIIGLDTRIPLLTEARLAIEEQLEAFRSPGVHGTKAAVTARVVARQWGIEYLTERVNDSLFVVTDGKMECRKGASTLPTKLADQVLDGVPYAVFVFGEHAILEPTFSNRSTNIVSANGLDKSGRLPSSIKTVQELRDSWIYQAKINRTDTSVGRDNWKQRVAPFTGQLPEHHGPMIKALTTRANSDNIQFGFLGEGKWIGYRFGEAVVLASIQTGVAALVLEASKTVQFSKKRAGIDLRKATLRDVREDSAFITAFRHGSAKENELGVFNGSINSICPANLADPRSQHSILRKLALEWKNNSDSNSPEEIPGWRRLGNGRIFHGLGVARQFVGYLLAPDCLAVTSYDDSVHVTQIMKIDGITREELRLFSIEDLSVLCPTETVKGFRNSKIRREALEKARDVVVQK